QMPTLKGDDILDGNIDLRLPASPPSGVLARLPAPSRDFSSLPIHVFLIPAASRDTTNPVRLRRTQPLTVQLTFLRPIVNGSPTPDLYVRVTYPRDLMQAGVDVVAERAVIAPSGEQVATQTRCRITATEAAQWR